MSSILEYTGLNLRVYNIPGHNDSTATAIGCIHSNLHEPLEQPISVEKQPQHTQFVQNNYYLCYCIFSVVYSFVERYNIIHNISKKIASNIGQYVGGFER